MKRIIFRADAKPAIGTGDLASLINLSKYFEKDGWEAHFIVKDYYAAIELLAKQGVANKLVLEDTIPIGLEVEKINNYAEANDIDAVMLEITERKLTEYAGLSDKVVKACINFDGVITHEMRLVVNWDVDAGNLFDQEKYPSTKFLLGPEYVILPLDFDFNRINARTYAPIPSVLLVAMGGADELNFTQKVIDSLIRKKMDLSLRVIVGSGYQHFKSLEASLKLSGLRYVLRQNIDDIFEEFMRVDAAIGAGGLTAFELIASRTPAFLIATYEHQAARCAYFNKMDWAAYLGFREFDEDMLFRGLTKPIKIPPTNIFKTEEIRKNVDGLLTRH